MTVSIIPKTVLKIGQLRSFAIGDRIHRLHAHLRRGRALLAIGGVDFSYNENSTNRSDDRWVPHFWLLINNAKGVKRVRRSRSAPAANRPWTIEECRTVLAELPYQLKLPVSLAMFTGLRKGDVLALTKSAIRNGRIWRRTNKTGQELSIPIHPDLARVLAGSPQHNAITIAATTNATPWTESGFNSSFIKAMAALKRKGKIGDGLTFHGLRHTVGTLLIEAGFDIDTVRRWLGQKTLAMAIHYSETADTSQRMREVMEKFDPLGSKSRT